MTFAAPGGELFLVAGLVLLVFWMLRVERRRAPRPSSFRQLKRLNEQHEGRDLRGRWS